MRCRLGTLLAAIAALAVAGCGGGDSSAEPAALVPASAPVFLEADLQSEGSSGEDIDALAQSIGGIDDVGEFIAEQLERSAVNSSFDFGEDVEPWLGEKAGLWLSDYDGDEFSDAAFALETTDTGATEEFIDELETNDGDMAGVIDGFFVFSENEDDFKAMEDAAEGDSLADADAYAAALSGVPDGSVADLYVDIGGLIEEASGAIDDETRVFLEATGLEPEEATAVASLVPGSDRLEIDLSSDVVAERPAGDAASELLASLPASSTAAFALEEFGGRLLDAIGKLDAEGIPGSVPPGKLEDALAENRFYVGELSRLLLDAAVFVEGSSKEGLGGALVLSTFDAEDARNQMANIALFLRSLGLEVTARRDELASYTVRSPDLAQPVIVAMREDRIVAAYGARAAAAALAGPAGPTLGEDPNYEKAAAALGGTPVAAYADGPRAVRLLSDLVADEGFQAAVPYLRNVDWLALGTANGEGRVTAKLIAGIGE